MRSRQISVLRQTVNGSTGQGCFRWNPSANQGSGPLVLNVSEGGFTVSVAITGTLSSGSPTVTGISNTIRIRKGLAVSGTGIPANTTVLSVDSATQITLSANATATGANSLTFSGTVYDPVIKFGYNEEVGGTEIVARDGYVIFQIEGHYQRDSDDTLYMEAFVAMEVSGAGGQARPIFTWYDKVNKVPLSVDLSPGAASALNVRFEDYAGAAGGVSFAFTKDKLLMGAYGTAANRFLDIESYTNYSTYLRMSTHGDSLSTGGTAQLICSPLGGSSQHRAFSLYMRSGSSSTNKTGVAAFRADDTAGYNSVMFQIGAGGSLNTALVTFSHANMPVNVPTFELIAKASQTALVLKMDGISNAGTVEANKWGVYPKGYVAVRESGNTTTDRAPGTGAQSVTAPTYTNKPGSTSPSGNPTAWFPMLTTAGALCWVPGWAD